MICSPLNLVCILTTLYLIPQVCWHLSLPVWKTSVTLWQSLVLARLGASATQVISQLHWPLASLAFCGLCHHHISHQG